MAVRVLADDGQYRLIGDERAGFAVLEVRAGRVYALEPHHRHSAPDDAEGMRQVVEQGPGWASKEEAWAVFAEVIEDEELYARIIW